MRQLIKNRRGNLELSLEIILSGGNKIILASGTLDEMILDKMPFAPTEVRKVSVVLIPPDFIPDISDKRVNYHFLKFYLGLKINEKKIQNRKC